MQKNDDDGSYNIERRKGVAGKNLKMSRRGFGTPELSTFQHTGLPTIKEKKFYTNIMLIILANFQLFKE